MYCTEGLCIKIEKAYFSTPPQRVEIKTERAVAICVKPEAVRHWLQLVQALFYAYYWRKPAKNPNISALMYLSQKDQIKDALEISAVGSREAICAALGPPEELEKVEMPRGEPYTPEGRWDPWEITMFALSLIK
ncbi:MAG: hypothetical protein ACK4SY_00080 [Pyrobaculum sp.]